MAKGKYPPSRDGEIFRKWWAVFLPEIMSRSNFRVGHLASLEILCELLEEKAKLQEILDMQGYTHISEGGRHGTVVKAYPEVGQINQCRAQIAIYSKMLGLVLAKDNSSGSDSENNDGDFE